MQESPQTSGRKKLNNPRFLADTRHGYNTDKPHSIEEIARIKYH
jgi:hypothetical protein